MESLILYSKNNFLPLPRSSILGPLGPGTAGGCQDRSGLWRPPGHPRKRLRRDGEKSGLD